MQHLKDVMTKGVEFLSPTSTMREAANKMRQFNIGALPVWDGEQVIGIVTGRDLAVRGVAAEKNPDKTHVSEIMTHDVICNYEDDTLLDAVEQMRDKKVKRVMVMTHDNQLRGILTLGDVAQEMGQGRLQGLVRDKVSQFAQRTNGIRRRGVIIGLGTVAGVSTLLAGVRYLRRQPEVVNRIRNRMGMERQRPRAA